MTITRIANNNTAQQVELIANSLEETFRRIVSAKACIIANFPQISTTPIDFFIWIKIPYKNGSYKAGMAKDFKDRQFLNNMVFTIRIIEIKDLVAIHGSNIIKKFSDGGSAELDLYAERHNDQFEISNFIKERIGIKYFHCPEVIWLKGYKKADIETLDIASMIFFDDTIFKMENVINHVAEEIIINNKNFTKGFYSYPEKDDEGNERDMNNLINNVIEAANKGSKYGILTKKKLKAITHLVNNTVEIIEAQNEGGKICLITGKAGSGKTLALARVMYEIARSKHHARFLTFNSLLVTDMKQTLRALSIKNNIENNQRLDSSNVSCQTIHKFFYNLAKNFDILNILPNRTAELTEVCNSRIEKAKQIFFDYYYNHNTTLPVNADAVLEREIHAADRKEIRNCISDVLYHTKNKIYNLSAEQIIDIINQEFEKYKNKRLAAIPKGELNNKFNSDYFKVLEVLYAKLVQPELFIYNKERMNRDDFLRWVSDANPNTTDQDIYSEVDKEELAVVKEQIDSAIRKIKWSNTIFVDEGQDCNHYEKLILQYLKNNEKLVIASGGKDQLIRTPEIIDWTKKFGGFSIPTHRVSLGKKTHRQKMNIVNFANRFAQLNNYQFEMIPDEELKGVGNVIIDTRYHEDGEIPNDITTTLLDNGKNLGYSQYESMLFLLPVKGKYVTRSSNGTVIQIDEHDNVYEEESYSDQKVLSKVEGINMWTGVGDAKNKSPFPQHNQSRFIYYESCRGLEACNVLCLDMDVFYEKKINSIEAERYVNQCPPNIFETEEDVRKRFATIWSTMIFTRAIDTLYIKLSNLRSEFSKTILQTAEGMPGVRILR